MNDLEIKVVDLEKSLVLGAKHSSGELQLLLSSFWKNGLN